MKTGPVVPIEKTKLLRQVVTFTKEDLQLALQPYLRDFLGKNEVEVSPYLQMDSNGDLTIMAIFNAPPDEQPEPTPTALDRTRPATVETVPLDSNDPASPFGLIVPRPPVGHSMYLMYNSDKELMGHIALPDNVQMHHNTYDVLGRYMKLQSSLVPDDTRMKHTIKLLRYTKETMEYEITTTNIFTARDMRVSDRVEENRREFKTTITLKRYYHNDTL